MAYIGGTLYVYMCVCVGGGDNFFHPLSPTLIMQHSIVTYSLIYHNTYMYAVSSMGISWMLLSNQIFELE